MNKNLYCETIDQIKISDDSRDKIMQALIRHSLIDNKEKKHPNRKLKLSLVATFFVIIISSYVFLSNNQVYKNNENGIYIEKIKLPESDFLMESDMAALIVYKGKVYMSYTDLKMKDINFEKIKGEYLGKTKNSIDEWSSQSDFTKEFASTIAETDVFSVNGYDTNFRIMTYDLYKGVVFYDCLNDMRIYQGEDLFGKMNIKDNLNYIQYLTFDNWNSGKYYYKDLETSKEINNNFINELYNAKYETHHDKTLEHLPIYFTLFDGSIIELILYEDGYVSYPAVSGRNGNGAFKMNKKAFDSIYSKLIKN